MTTAKPIVTVTEDITLITIQGVPSGIDFIAEVFEKIASFDINVDMISVTPPQGTLVNLSFTISDDDLGKVLEFTASLRDEINNIKPIVSSGNYKISILDEAMEHTPGTAAKIFRAAAQANTDIRIITTSEVQITLLVTEAAFDTTYDTIMCALNLQKK